jgi:glycine/D-amino acid oxidase-like deaminating enzyme
VTNSTGSRHSDVLVIGAGVIGCSIALHLRRLGHAVHVLERAEIGAGTSSRGFGLVWAQTKSPNAYLELTMASVAYYPELLDSLGTNCDYQRPGGLVLLESEAQAADMQALMRQQTRTPAFTVEFLDQRQARELEPALAESLLGATYCPLDGHLDPKQLTAAFGEAALRAGARIHPQTAVVRLDRRAGDWIVQTSAGEFSAPVVVNCAGVWAPEIARLVGFDLPVRPERGQILVTPPRPPILRHPTPDLRQDSSGRIWMGTVHSSNDWDLAVREADSHAILESAQRQLPALRGTPIQDCWAGLRPMPGDGHPILGALPGIDGQYVAVGHSGITLAPIEGKLMAELIATGQRAALLEPFGPERFIATIRPVPPQGAPV